MPARKPAVPTVMAWEDDPDSGGTPISRPVPALDTADVPVRIQSAGPAPAIYPLGTPEFRYWTAAEALERGTRLWSRLIPGLTWHPNVGDRLSVYLDVGETLNAYYNRSNLSFYHARVGGRILYTGESPDVLSHELGHAVLDAIRPQLWDAMSIEAAAMHESFGDMSSLLTGLQLPSLRAAVLQQTGGVLYRASRLSRLAEQLGWGIRQNKPDGADPDCLRNAVNSFFYRPPEELPPSGPASVLTSAPHNFSRVFTGAFFEALGGMLASLGAATEEALLQASEDAGTILVAGIRTSPVVPAYFSQVAAHMLAAEAKLFKGRYRDALKGGFVRHGILSLQAATSAVGPRPATALRGVAAAAPGGPETDAPLPVIRLGAADYGLGVSSLTVHAAGETQRFAAAGAAFDLGSAEAPAHDRAAQVFVEDLMRRGRIDLGEVGDPARRVALPHASKTHRLEPEADSALLRRIRFDCGFD